MTSVSAPESADALKPGVSPTPADRRPLPANPEVSRRRLAVISLNALTYIGLLWWLWSILCQQGWSFIDLAIFACFAIAAPWSVLGVWNAILGVWLLQGRRGGLDLVAPFAAGVTNDEPVVLHTAIMMTIRNEDPLRAFRRFDIVKHSVDATGHGDMFGWFILSDTTDADVAAREEAAFAEWRVQNPSQARIHYRRRADNTGFKAGNVRDFCERWGADYEFMLPLDADSLMTGETILRMVRIAQASPKLGILQSLVVGAPSTSAFARIFQFGMRHGMRPYTMGSAYWAADCGPFWGHNALVRIAPFMQHCELPVLPGAPPLGGPILSHDQVEAVMMRRAGYEVRVLPEECGSYEDNPPTLLEFTRRDLRWCQGNLQYVRLLGLPGIQPMSRFQLVWAIAMFIGLPAWTAIIALSALKPFDGEDPALFPAASAAGLYCVFLLMYLAPKLAGFLDIALTPGALKRYGGAAHFFKGALTEVLFSFLLGAVTTFRTTLFMIGLAFGRSVIWNGQSRDAHALSWATAFGGLWPQLLFGLVVNGLFFRWSPALLLWALPLTLGYLLAIPFAVMTADPALGRRLATIRICGLPEEFDPPAEIIALREPAKGSP